MNLKILLVDDDKKLVMILKSLLTEEHHEVETCSNGREAVEKTKTQNFDLVITDLMMPGMSGIEVLKEIRNTSPDTLVIIVTGFASVPSAVEALRHGAHDYLTKPFNTEELLASVADGLAQRHAQLPTPTEPRNNELSYGDLALNYSMHQVTRADEVLDLTPTEFDLLACLMESPNIALDSVALLKRIRGYEASESEARAIIRVHVHRLRQKLELDPAFPRYVTTVAGGRYVFTPLDD